MIYLISYNRNILLKSYAPLQEAIKQSSTSWWHHLNDTWLVRTNLTAAQLFENLKPHLSQADRLLVIAVHPNMKGGIHYQGWLNDKAWQWIRENQEKDNPRFL